MEIKENEPLAQYTTTGLGGLARYFTVCTSIDDIKAALQFARDQKIRWHILGGGSNTIFADNGFDGLILKIELVGFEFEDDGEHVLVKAQAGEVWDKVVEQCVQRCLAGIECLSGVPGLVGALPVQNVGAYGQQVSDTIVKLQALDTHTLELTDFSKEECGFDYRTSRFKTADAGRFIITEVSFRLQQGGEPRLEYPDIVNEMATQEKSSNTCGVLSQVRQAVLRIRARKSMLIDKNDINTRSCGSFFTNAVLSESDLAALRNRCAAQGMTDTVPVFPSGNNFKVSAAWLIEHAGFRKGEKRGNVGISEHHVLALVNHAGTAQELLAFASEIQNRVKDLFDVRLELEPVIVPQLKGELTPTPSL